jgi:hypothetical protein
MLIYPYSTLVQNHIRKADLGRDLTEIFSVLESDATPAVHGLMSAEDKMRFDVISRTYPSVLYVAFAPETIDPAHITLTDFDVDGVLALVSGNRILVPIGVNSGIWIIDPSLTSMTRDP